MLSSDFLFPRFFVVPLANPSNFSHCKCFSSRIGSSRKQVNHRYKKEEGWETYVNSIDDPRFGQCFHLYFLQPMLLASTRL